MEREKAIIDQSCKNFDLSLVTSFLEERQIPVSAVMDENPLETILDDSPYSRILYFVSLDSGAQKYQLDFVRKAKSVRQWLIVLTGEKSFSTDRTIQYWQSKSSGLGAFVKVIFIEPGTVGELVRSMDILIESKINSCVIASNKSSVGRKTFAMLLANKIPDYTFCVCNYEDYCEQAPKAGAIFIIGTQSNDFLLPPPDDGFNRVTLILNKIDESPVSLVRAEETKHEILKAMNHFGWNIPDSFSRFHITSLKYESFNSEIRDGKLDCGSLKLNTEFLLWDDFGLPQPRAGYSEHAITNFLGKFNELERIEKSIRG